VISVEPDGDTWHALFCPRRKMVLGPLSSGHARRLQERFQLVPDEGGVRHLRRPGAGRSPGQPPTAACGRPVPGEPAPLTRRGGQMAASATKTGRGPTCTPAGTGARCAASAWCRSFPRQKTMPRPRVAGTVTAWPGGKDPLVGRFSAGPLTAGETGGIRSGTRSPSPGPAATTTRPPGWLRTGGQCAFSTSPPAARARRHRPQRVHLSTTASNGSRAAGLRQSGSEIRDPGESRCGPDRSFARLAALPTARGKPGARDRGQVPRGRPGQGGQCRRLWHRIGCPLRDLL
jgi:hypothetical protein